MATTISIQSGPLTASRTFQNDAKAQATLLTAYTELRLGPDSATNSEKLDAIVDWIVQQVRSVAVQGHIQVQQQAAFTDAQNTYGFED